MKSEAPNVNYLAKEKQSEAGENPVLSICKTYVLRPLLCSVNHVLVLHASVSIGQWKKHFYINTNKATACLHNHFTVTTFKQAGKLSLVC
jgi:hypothetical protein